ncbi:MAG: ammonium transporter, partial [Chloroflexi bacterium]|nr:ammonium transporter [Chloroflexota bacterium]
IAISRSIMGRTDLFVGLNGAIAGLVSITAGPDIVDHYWAIIIGAIGAILCTLGLKLLEKLKLDDVVGAVPAHLFAGIWGTLAAAIAGGASFGVQVVGVLAVGAFVFVVSYLVWRLIDLTIKVRVSRQVEQLGQDAGELGIEAYPEFVLMPEEFDED